MADVLAMKPKSRGLLSALPLDPSRFHEAQLSPDASARRRQDQSISAQGWRGGRPAAIPNGGCSSAGRQSLLLRIPLTLHGAAAVAGTTAPSPPASSSAESAIFAEGSCSQVKFSRSPSASPGFGVPSQGGVCSAQGRAGSPRAGVLLAPGGWRRPRAGAGGREERGHWGSCPPPRGGRTLVQCAPARTLFSLLPSCHFYLYEWCTQINDAEHFKLNFRTSSWVLRNFCASSPTGTRNEHVCKNCGGSREAKHSNSVVNVCTVHVGTTPFLKNNSDTPL